MFVRRKMGYVRAKIGLTGQFDQCQPGNYLNPCQSIFFYSAFIVKDVYLKREEQFEIFVSDIHKFRLWYKAIIVKHVNHLSLSYKPNTGQLVISWYVSVLLEGLMFVCFLTLLGFIWFHFFDCLFLQSFQSVQLY